MGVITQVLAFASLLSSFATTVALPSESRSLAKRDTPCDNGPWAPVLTIGDSQAQNFCETQFVSEGKIIQGLEVWSDNKGIYGILFTYSTGETALHGSQDGTSQSLTMAAGEIISTATLWGNGKGQNLGHMYIKTDKQEFDTGMPKSATGYPIQTGGGLLVGAVGATGDTYLGNFAFLFLNSKIASIEIGSVAFSPDPTGTSTNIEPVYLIQTTMGNPNGSTGNISFTVSGTQTVTETTTWDQSTTGTFGMSVSVQVKAEPFGVGADITTGAEWSVAHTGGTGGSTTNTITITNSIGPVSIGPGHGKACKIFSQKGTGNFPYTSVVTVNLESGNSFNYQESGTLDEVQYSNTLATCADSDDPTTWDGTQSNPPTGVTLASTSPTKMRKVRNV